MNKLRKVIAKSIQKDEGLLKHGSILFFALIITSIFNYLFQVYVGRALGPANYGIFGSLVSILHILSVPAGVVRLTIARFISEFRAKSEYGKAKYLAFYSFKRLLFFGLGCSVLIIFCSGVITSFLHLPSRIPLLILGLVLLISVIYPIAIGVLQGLQNFFQLGLNHIFAAGFKLIFGVLLLFIGLGVNGALLALFLGPLVALLLAFIPLKFLFWEEKVEAKDYEIIQYSLPVLIAMLCLTLITSVDIILVKHFFDPTESGYYVAASLLAKVILFATLPIGNAMFPKVSELHAREEDTMPILRSSLFYVGLISLLCLIIYFVNPTFVVSTLFGSAYPGTIGLIGIFGVGMMFFSLSHINIMYKLAVKKFRFLYILTVAPILEIVLIVFFHFTLITVVEIFLIVAASLFFGMLFVDRSSDSFPLSKGS